MPHGNRQYQCNLPAFCEKAIVCGRFRTRRLNVIGDRSSLSDSRAQSLVFLGPPEEASSRFSRLFPTCLRFLDHSFEGDSGERQRTDHRFFSVTCQDSLNERAI